MFLLVLLNALITPLRLFGSLLFPYWDAFLLFYTHLLFFSQNIRIRLLWPHQPFYLGICGKKEGTTKKIRSILFLSISHDFGFGNSICNAVATTAILHKLYQGLKHEFEFAAHYYDLTITNHWNGLLFLHFSLFFSLVLNFFFHLCTIPFKFQLPWQYCMSILYSIGITKNLYVCKLWCS